MSSKQLHASLSLLLLGCAPTCGFLHIAVRGLANVPAVGVTSNTVHAWSTRTVAPDVGETQGGALLFEELSIAAGANTLINEVNWKINMGERVAIVGPNGAGKSTLLSAVAGQMLPEKGSVKVHQRMQLGYLVQTAVSGSERPLKEEVMSQMVRYHEAKAALSAAEESVSRDPTPQNLLALERAQAVWVEEGGEDIERKVRGVLGGLGFSSVDYNKSCTAFSGGWQMRIALARTLLAEPSLLLLDEPTNHLDVSAKAWLMQFLAIYPGTVLLVSHELQLLKEFRCTTVAELANKELGIYKCDYDGYLVQREQRSEALQATFERQEKETARIQRFIDRFGAKASLAASANSRKKMLERMDRVSAPVASTKRPKLELPLAPSCGPELIKLSDASIGHPGVPALVEHVDLSIARGSRIAILGPNGAGKSTVLKALCGLLPLQEGTRTVGQGVEMGVFTQDLAQDLPQDQVALEYVLTTVRQRDLTISDERARAALGALGLSGEKALRPIGVLSGGEKARVALGVFVLVPHNLLILDEPTNHLDAVTVDVLTSALAEYPGTLIMVSHNQPVVQKLRPTHVGLLRDRKLVVEERDLRPTDWMDGDVGPGGQGQRVSVETSEKSVEDDGPKLSYAEQRAQFKRISAAPKRIAKLEQLIAEKEKEVERLDREMYQAGADAAKVKELYERKQRAEDEVAKMYTEWEELEGLLAGAGKH